LYQIDENKDYLNNILIQNFLKFKRFKIKINTITIYRMIVFF